MVARNANNGRVVALAGGVGGAKLAHGLALALDERRLSVVVNTADDFTLYGLHISPDLDTVMYTLGGLANPETGWGIKGDSFAALEMMRRFGRDTWFWLGDRDFATHILRTERLKDGASLTTVTAELASALGIQADILPMCDEPVATLIETPDGPLDFQDYFVRRHQTDDVLGVQFRGIKSATLPNTVIEALDEATAIILCPSNPIVSIGPLLTVPGFRERLQESQVPIVAVSPIIGGQALKGPADRMLATLGHEVSAVGVAAIYRDFLQGMVIDEQDAALAGQIEELGIAVEVTNTIMRSNDDRRVLAEECLRFVDQLRL
ncbi:MAG: 2-phospho-L-lactate transferase [Thermomicrobiales bacterium]|nr:2-phospho-L-lactate transferase [Thermomicrobiales bacterium]